MMPLGGLRSNLIHRPGEGLRFGKAGVETRPKPVETLLLSRRGGGEVEWLVVDQHAMHDDGQLAGQCHLRGFHAGALGDPGGPALEA
jgi:hypothetical protein